MYNNIDKNATYSSFEELEALFFKNSKKYSVKKQKHSKNNLANIYAIIVPHYYYGFYVYKYALGYVIANAFYARISKENFNGEEIDNYINNFFQIFLILNGQNIYLSIQSRRCLFYKA